MENNLFNQSDYLEWLYELKSKVKQSQIKAAVSVNSELILLYYDLGKQISEKLKNNVWGSKFIEKLSNDLKSEFPNVGGFSAKNLRYCKQFYDFYCNSDLWQQPVAELTNNEDYLNNNMINLLVKIPWGHHILIMQKNKSIENAILYIQKTIENNWSRSVLEYHIETKLCLREGKTINNFKLTLPKNQSDLANQILKDPYNFEFLNIQEEINEKELEQSLVDNITKFLLELGKGFAYMGKQYKINIGDKEYRIDLLFYHTILRCYVVVELKVTDFQSEFIAKLNFYISAINELIKSEQDKPTIGILLCKNKNNFEVEFALKDINKPIGVSTYTYKELPINYKDTLPTPEEFDFEFKKLNYKINNDLIKKTEN